MGLHEYNYILTDAAITDIDEILSYISGELLNPVAANAFMDNLEEKINEVCKNPNSGRIIDNDFLKMEGVRRFLVNNYIGYYAVKQEDSLVIILRIVYVKQDQDKVINDL